MKKDIYIIKNKINSKVYVGQSVNANERFLSHCKKQKKYDSIVDAAIAKYGKENFWVEILESGVENYNEREVYWIEKLNSTAPNGYNLSEGGEEPPHYYAIDSPQSSFKSWDIIHGIKNDLRTTQLSLSSIAKKYGTSKRTIMRINDGVHYAEDGDGFPIRKKPLKNGKLSPEDVDKIVELLQMSYLTYLEIGKMFGVSDSRIKQINTGECMSSKKYQYPIRTWKNTGSKHVPYDEISTIIDEILNTKISLRKIAQKHNLPLTTIYNIKNGNAKKYRRPNLHYPLRPHN